MNLTIILKNVDKNHGKLSLILNDDFDYDYAQILDDVSRNNTFSKRNIPGTCQSGFTLHIQPCSFNRPYRFFTFYPMASFSC